MLTPTAGSAPAIRTDSIDLLATQPLDISAWNQAFLDAKHETLT